MRGHVFVTDSAWTLKTDADGIARFTAVPDGAAQLRVWHAEQLVDLPRKNLQVQTTPVLDTMQLSVVPRPRRPLPASAPCASKSGQRAVYPLLIALRYYRGLSAASGIPSKMQLVTS